ncbi:hypothetical protein C8J48_2410 [Desmospora activa DSM 45169]|uniref:Uncharacterized protein n=1 Tax=Desmospora activa DSM 45169 TaxID=1121389 RepID=A0A2T4ZD07_9BACL|nr:hypothetical protein C8J48_2410 [Desmospora activa DSM 45169]
MMIVFGVLYLGLPLLSVISGIWVGLKKPGFLILIVSILINVLIYYLSFFAMGVEIRIMTKAFVPIYLSLHIVPFLAIRFIKAIKN